MTHSDDKPMTDYDDLSDADVLAAIEAGGDELGQMIAQAGFRKLRAAGAKLVPYLESDDPDVVMEAIETIGRIRHVPAASSVARILQETSRPARVLDTAAYVLGQLGSGRGFVGPLSRALQSSHPSVRINAAVALGAIAGVYALPWLEAARRLEKDAKVSAGLDDLVRALSKGLTPPQQRPHAFRNRGFPDGQKYQLPAQPIRPEAA